MKIYTIDTAYIAYLRTIDKRVPIQHKNLVNRPYAGIIVMENQQKYFIPLSSPKPKHIHMKNQLDFIKIADGKLGVLNLNNMIPVPDTVYKEINVLALLKSKSSTDNQYGGLLDLQEKWLTKNKDFIYTKAKALYKKYKEERLPYSIYKRCLSYTELELGLKEYSIHTDKQPELTINKRQSQGMGRER